MNRIIIVLISIFFCISCTSNKYAVTNRAYKKQSRELAKQLREYPLKDSFATASEWVGTTNFSMRKPNFVIIHHTAQGGCDTTLRTFTLPRTQVSAHYVICENGTIYHMLHDNLRAWHAGSGRWGNLTDINSASIGIELDNDGSEPFPETQINSLVTLLGHLKRSHSIPTANFIGHADIAPTRKVDPNVNFPWKQMAENGFGLWYDDTSKISVPATFDPVIALRIIGYDVRDVSAATQAFRRRFLQVEARGVLTEAEKKVLFAVMKKFM